MGSEPLLEHLPFTLRQAGQHVLDFVLQEADRRDVRRIGLTAALMFGILAALHVAVNVAGVISL